MSSALRLAPLTLLLAAGCAAKTPPAPAPEPAAAPAPAPDDLAPKPHTLEQLRGAFPAGSRFTLRLEMGGQARLSTTVFTQVDAERAVIDSQDTDLEGKALGPAEHSQVTWSELHGHASFPKATTTVTETAVEVPIGKLDCWLYTVQREEEGQAFEMRFYFAKKLPGPPVQFERWQGGQRVMQAVQVAREPLLLLP